ncbi:hypothetical protein BVRB_013180 [Beta vulgaris subsp. vulgaris]|uniref:Uncharacterized protein n=1 Tax=Beta vulgaris subsp. vulgaris TaxID=3555 RepID=A0A0J8B5F1_BETVV|nr:hypothetical protein BVRB_013180 [Beta vulgaris subsp. vulgaris]
MDPITTGNVDPDGKPVSTKYSGPINDPDPVYVEDEDPGSPESDPITPTGPNPRTPSSGIAHSTAEQIQAARSVLDIVASDNQLNSSPSKRPVRVIGCDRDDNLLRTKPFFQDGRRLEREMTEKRKVQNGLDSEGPADQQKPKVIRHFPQKRPLSETAFKRKTKLSKDVLSDIFNSGNDEA